MPTKKRPRFGSMQFWPRKRARRSVARVRSWATGKDAQPLGIAGYKAGMTHVTATDTRKHSTSKNQTITIPATIIECPPVRIYSVRAYKASGYGTSVAKEVVLSTEKDLARKVPQAKKQGKLDDLKPDEYEDITIICHTQPGKIGFKRSPDLYEVKLGGSNEDKLHYIKDHVGKDIPISDLYQEGDYTDLHAVTKGKGFQGAVKRFGIGLTPHKSEKGRRTPGSLGGWKGHAHFMYRVAYPGQTGYHQRVQYNNLILKISDNPDEVNPKGGLVNYGNVKTTYILIKGTVPGAKKRPIIMVDPVRPDPKAQPLPTIKAISTESKQGR